MIGKTLAHYKITESIGRGGMGEVFRAQDTKLGRDVAIKVLPTEMSGDPERLARFDREARTLATLQHAHIASIYGFEIVDNTRFLVMELVEGEDMSERLQQGAVPVPEVVDLAAQMAEGLTAAHAMGIMHRDLKPANLKVSPDGQLKILDFGLARTQLDDAASDPNLENSPTITAMTQAGVILGTAAYMSPEQARGKNVDHRADIWAYGVVLFEMLTGQRLFEGETVSDTLAGVLRADVPWDALPADTPPTLRRLLKRCLERDPNRRLQAIGEARIALDDLKAGRTDGTQPDPTAEAAAAAAAAGPASKRERLIWAVLVSALIAALGLVYFNAPAPPEQPMIQTILLPPDGWDLAPATPLAMSPDGKQIAYMAVARPENEETAQGTQAIWIRDLDMPQARLLTTVDRNPYPFWSPDSRWLGFYSDSKLNKIEVRGGPVIPLCEATNGRGGTWNEDGTIVFQQRWSEGLMRVQSGGGTPEAVTTLNEEQDHVAHRWPTFLPDGRHFLFYVVSTTNPTSSEYSGIYVGSLDSAEIRQILKTESRALYAQEHLIYRAGRTLMAHPFDASSQSLTGDPTPVATDIPGGSVSWGGAQFGLTEAGMLVHMRGSGAAQTVLTWRNRQGEVLETVGDADDFWEPTLSYDGTRIATSVGSNTGDVWIYDLTRDMRTRFSFDAADDRNPQWSPDDRHVVFSSERNTGGGLYVRPTAGQGQVELLYETDTQVEPTDWSSDGRLIFFNRLTTGENGYDVWMFDTETSEAGPVLEGQFNQIDANLSPDGKWLAFASSESGNFEVYVQPFTGGQGRWMISSDGTPGTAWESRWRADGKELFYLRGSTLMAVSVTGGESFSFGTPEPLFSVNVVSSNADFSVSPDGQRILTNELPPTDISNMGAILIQNWVGALKR